MAKAPPAYQYYPSDFDASTKFFTLEEVGAYQRLLNAQWENGFIPDDVRKLAMAIGTTPDRMPEIWETLEEKFPVVSKGKRANPRLERVRSEQKEYSEKQSRAGKAGAKARWGKKKEGDSASDDDGDRNATANGDRIATGSATAYGQNIALQSPSPSSSLSPSLVGSKRVRARSASQAYDDPEFQKFWSAYPKKVSKGEAAKAWSQTDPSTNGEYVKRPLLDKVLNSIRIRKKSRDWQEDSGKYIPNPASWLRSAGWDDFEGDVKVCRDCGRESESPEGFQPYGLCLPCSQKPEHRPHGCPHLSGGRWDSTREKFLPDGQWEAEFGTPPSGNTQQVMLAFHRGELPPNPSREAIQ